MQNENYLVHSTTIKKYLKANELIGRKLSEIDLKQIEKKVLSIKLIQKCQIYRDLGGTIQVDIQEHQPIARVISSYGGNPEKTDNYVAEEGDFIGVSKKYTARVLLLSGMYFNDKVTLNQLESKPILDLVKVINADEFWKAQIAQLVIEKDGGITFVPTTGNHKIEFGLAMDIDVKLKKLKLFYTQILKKYGWDKYKKVSLKYQNQIVCEAEEIKLK
ncbi:MAG: FtsQ-type POTRA domain-containing protein [Pseudarcicella sp.]|nr:FtsQ-type POTRA domain-containing protein [Pseudarcicella sp.]